MAATGLAIYPPMLLCEAALRCEARVSAIGGGPPFHCYCAKWRCLFATKHEPNCVHVLTPFVERFATEEEKRTGTISPEVVCRSPGE